MSEDNTVKAPAIDKPPVFGIISTILGGASLLPFLGILSLIGLLLGILGLNKEQKKTLAIVGTTLSALGGISSPFIWAFISNVFFPPNANKAQLAAEGYSTSGPIISLVIIVAILAMGAVICVILEKKTKENK